MRFIVFRGEKERWMAAKLNAGYRADRGRKWRQWGRNRLRAWEKAHPVRMVVSRLFARRVQRTGGFDRGHLLSRPGVLRHKEAEHEHDAQLANMAAEERGLREEETAANDRLKLSVDLLVEQAGGLAPALAASLNENERVRLAGLLPEAEVKYPGVVPMVEPKLELRMKPDRGSSLGG
ncbi:MAG: hypothetical protein ACRD3J_14500 [Thermoanaerobaculia bacterium]